MNQQLKVNSTLKTVMVEQMQLAVKKEFETYLGLIFEDLVARDGLLATAVDP